MSELPSALPATPPVCRECGGALSSGGSGGVCARCIVAEMQQLPLEEPGSVPRRYMGGYELLECIGRGGAGTVYRARHSGTGADRALKMLSAGELAAPEARRRFLKEAEAAAGLHHPHIVTLHEAGMQDGMPFYVMDYLPGRTLADAVREKPMPAHAAAACMARVAAAMQHAHSRGVLHRDLKPSNILLDELGEPRVADFGLARHMDAASSITGSRQIVGSPPYMSPEQAAGGAGKVTYASDVYALGAVLYHLLTGRPPFAGETPQAVLRHVTEDEPIPPRRVIPSIPRELETITLKCLEKSPARRYASAAGLEADLERFLQGEPVLARPVSTAARWWRRARRYPAVTALSLLLVAGAVTGITFILQKNRELSRSAAEKTTALQENKATLAESLLWQAEFQRLTGKPGQREGSLASIREVMKLPLSPEQKLRARNAAIAAMALPDATFEPSALLPVPAGPGQGLVSRGGIRYAWIMPDGKVQILHPYTGQVLATHDPAPNRVDTLLTWSQDGSVLAWRCNGTRLGLCHWKLGPMPWTHEVWERAELALPNQVEFQPIRESEIIRPWRVMHPERDGSITIREAYTSLPWRSVPPPPGPPPQWSAIGYSVARDVLAAACGSRPEIVIWDMTVQPPAVLRTLKCQSVVHSLDWENTENWLLAGDVTGRITAWDARTWEPQPPFEGHSQPVNCTMSGAANNYRHISAGADGTIRLWDRGALRPLLTLPGHANRLSFQSSEMRAGPVLRDGRAGWYELQWSPIFHSLNPPEKSEGAQRVVWHPDGGIFACLTGHAAVIFRRARGTSNALVIPAAQPTAATFTPGGRLLLIASAAGLQAVGIHRPAAGPDDAPLSLRGPLEQWLPEPCQDVSLATGKDRMAILRRDGTLCVYDLLPQRKGPGKITHTFRVPPLSRCVLSPDGRWLATGSPAGNDAALTDLNGTAGPVPLPAVRNARAWLPVFNSTSRQLAWSGYGTVLMEPEKPEEWQTLPHPPNESGGCGAVFIPTRDANITWLAAAGADEEIYLFETGRPCRHFATLRAPSGGRIGELSIARSGRLVCALPRGEVHQWTLPEMRRHIEELGLSWESPQ